ERLAEKFLVREGPVCLGSVEEGDPAVDGLPDEGDHLLPVRRTAVAEAHPHAAEPDGGDLEAALSQVPRLHGLLLRRHARKVRLSLRGWYTGAGQFLPDPPR